MGAARLDSVPEFTNPLAPCEHLDRDDAVRVHGEDGLEVDLRLRERHGTFRRAQQVVVEVEELLPEHAHISVTSRAAAAATAAAAVAAEKSVGGDRQHPEMPRNGVSTV